MRCEQVKQFGAVGNRRDHIDGTNTSFQEKIADELIFHKLSITAQLCFY